MIYFCYYSLIHMQANKVEKDRKKKCLKFPTFKGPTLCKSHLTNFRTIMCISRLSVNRPGNKSIAYFFFLPLLLCFFLFLKARTEKYKA